MHHQCYHSLKTYQLKHQQRIPPEFFENKTIFPVDHLAAFIIFEGLAHGYNDKKYPNYIKCNVEKT